MVDVVHFIPKAAIFYDPDWTVFWARRGWASVQACGFSGRKERACPGEATAGSLLVLLLKETGSKLSHCPDPRVGQAVTLAVLGPGSPSSQGPWCLGEEGAQSRPR